MERKVRTDDEARADWLELPPFHLTMEQFKRLPEYSATVPTGVTLGKTWKRHNGAHDPAFRLAGGRPRWIICRYEDAPAQVIRGKLTQMCKTATYRPVIKVKMGREVCSN